MKRQNQSTDFSRRKLLKFLAGATVTVVLASRVGSKLAFPEPVVAHPHEMTPDEALQRLIEGNKRFVNGRTNNPRRDMVRIAEVATAQKPFASILTCADSRLPAEMVFDQGFGDLFVCRVAGNVATPEEIGSLEYGTLILESKVLMVMGHERCGAVTAAIKGGQVPGQIGSLIDAIKPAIKRAENQPGDKLANTCKENILLQIENLLASPVIAKLVDEGKLKIVGGYYDLDTGEVSLVS
ncbi:MAG: carbonic anhydrase [Symploca sp. SIO2C1]|nr:carbonic anhydrase [Symploca sp. SIO2C1]